MSDDKYALIHSDTIQKVLENTDICDVISTYVDLKKLGKNYKGCCPFHKEKTPSFSVNYEKQFYYCFGCGEHGDAINFLVKHLGVSFVDAVTDLANRAGIQIESTSTNSHESVKVNPVLQNLMNEANKFYLYSLTRDVPLLEYILKRGISPQTAKKFGLGFAPDGWQNLQVVYANYEMVELELCGLTAKSKSKRTYDRFRGRLMFPILSKSGNIIGFGGRAITNENQPKYLNSPETVLFNKGSELYGLWQANQSIRDEKTVIVVEGYMDVISVSESGIHNVVGTMGTATTSKQASLLLKMADRVIFCFDGDSAGIKAAWKAMENSIPFITDTKSLCFVFLPRDEDPDSYVRKIGKKDFLKMTKNASNFSDYIIRSLIELSNPVTAEAKAKFIHNAIPLVSKIDSNKASLLKLQMIKKLSALSGFSISELNIIFADKSK